MMPEVDELSGPYLSATFLCDRVLQEGNGVLSFIRIVDRFVRPRPTEQIPPQPIQVNLAIIFKGGGLPPGNYLVKIRVFKPSTSSPAVEMGNDVFFDGGQDRGMNIVIPFMLLAEEDGLYWIEILFAERLFTRIPFRVILAAAQAIPVRPSPAGA